MVSGSEGNACPMHVILYLIREESFQFWSESTLKHLPRGTCRRQQSLAEIKGEDVASQVGKTLFWGGDGRGKSGRLQRFCVISRAGNCVWPPVSVLTGPGVIWANPHISTQGRGIQKANRRGHALEIHVHGGENSENDRSCLTCSETHIFSRLFRNVWDPLFITFDLKSFGILGKLIADIENNCEHITTALTYMVPGLQVPICVPQ